MKSNTTNHSQRVSPARASSGEAIWRGSLDILRKKGHLLTWEAWMRHVRQVSVLLLCLGMSTSLCLRLKQKSAIITYTSNMPSPCQF